MNGNQKRQARKKAQHLIPLGMCEICRQPATDRHHEDHSGNKLAWKRRGGQESQQESRE